MENNNQPKGLRTKALKLIMSYNMSVREFNNLSRKTKLSSTKDINVVKLHMINWQQRGWISNAKN